MRRFFPIYLLQNNSIVAKTFVHEILAKPMKITVHHLLCYLTSLLSAFCQDTFLFKRIFSHMKQQQQHLLFLEFVILSTVHVVPISSLIPGLKAAGTYSCQAKEGSEFVKTCGKIHLNFI